MFTEKRQFPRAVIPCKISTVFAERVLVLNSHTENIGVGGIKVILEEKLHVSTEVDLDLFLLDKEKPLKCKGKIVWVDEITPVEIRPRLFDTGIEFTQISDFDKQEVVKFVNTLLSKSQKDKA